MIVTTSSAEETEALGRRLGRLLRPGDVIALSGDLGAGKTILAHGIAEGLGATGYIASPTFTLVREYAGQVPISHVDLYRLDTPRQVEDIALDEILERPGIVVIEWAEKALALLPAAYLWITIRFGNGEDARVIEVIPRGERYEDLVEQIADAHSRD